MTASTFSAFNVRRYQGKLLIKPSKAAVQRHRERLAAEMLALRGANAKAVIARLNPIIRGWSAYYRGVVSSEAFAKLDDYLWTLTYKWAKHSHPNKSKRWVVNRYFGQFNKSRRDRWVFGDRDSGAYLLKYCLDQDRPAPDGARHGVSRRPGPGRVLGQAATAQARHRWTASACACLKAQHGRCPLCGALLLLRRP